MTTTGKMQMAGLALIFGTLCVILAIAEGADSTTKPEQAAVTVSSLAGQLDQAKEEDAGMQIIAPGIALLRDSPLPDFQQELAFTINVFNFSVRFPRADPMAVEAIKLMKVRHKADPVALARILKLEAAVATLRPETREKAADLLRKAIDESVRGRVNAALLEMELRDQLATVYLLQRNGADPKPRDAALFQYRNILSFPLIDQPYFTRVGDFQNVYVSAALRLVELTPDAELRGLHFYPFALNEIGRFFPQKFAHVSKVPPEVVEFKKRVAFWLELNLKAEPKESPMWPHWKAVADYAAKEANE